MAKRRRLLWQLYPSYLLIVLISVLAVTWFVWTSLKGFYLDQVAGDLRSRAALLEHQIAYLISQPGFGAVDRFCKEVKGSTLTRVTVILPSGKVIGDSEEDPAVMDNHGNRPEIRTALTGVVGLSTRYSRTLKMEMMYAGIPIKKGDEILGVLRTSFPLTSVYKAMEGFRLKVALWGLVIAVFAAGVCLVVSRRISRPIEQMKDGAERFAAGDLDHRLAVPDSMEMGGLAEALNHMALDLDERIKTILRQRNEFEAVYSSMVEGVIAVDKEERIINMNQSAARIFGCDPVEARGRSIQEMIRNTALQDFIGTALASRGFVEKEIMVFPDGETTLNGHGTVLLDEKGRQIGALIVLNDITRLRRLESVRRDFAANVSHEIRTPITAIKGFVETLRQGGLNDPAEADRFLGIIQKHVDRLNALIEDLLSLSRIEQEYERSEIALEPGPITDPLGSAVQVCRNKADEKNIQIELDCSCEIYAGMNPPLLEQAFVNLLDNAIKYSRPESKIEVYCSRSGREVAVAFKDYGMGISREHIPRLFERFYRADKARSRKLGGTGLGLAIVKHIVQAHKGRITVESRPAKGSTFTVYLPVV